MKVEIRIAAPQDLESILTLFKTCVWEVCRYDYSEEQLKVWTSAAENVDRWNSKIEEQFFIVAIHNEAIVGFGSLEGRDTIDLLYIHHNFQRAGVAAAIINALQVKAEQLGAEELRAEVSKSARRFFERKGFNVVVKQSKTIDSVELENFQMIKSL